MILAGRILYGAEQEITEWVRQRVDENDTLTSNHAIGVVRHGKIIAGVVYTGFRGTSIELVFAADNKHWATRDVIATILNYPFEFLGAKRLTSIVEESNAKAMRLNEGVGYTKEGVIRCMFTNGNNGILYGLLKDEFYEGKYGQQIKQRSTTTSRSG